MWRHGRKHFGRGGALYCQSSLQEETDIDLAVLSFFFFLDHSLAVSVSAFQLSNCYPPSRAQG